MLATSKAKHFTDFVDARDYRVVSRLDLDEFCLAVDQVHVGIEGVAANVYVVSIVGKLQSHLEDDFTGSWNALGASILLRRNRARGGDGDAHPPVAARLVRKGL